MPINVDEIIERALEQAFAKALEQVIQDRAGAFFKKAFKRNGSTFGKRLEEKIEQGLTRFMEEGTQWDKKMPGFAATAQQ